jgi:hypothetical protein
MRGRKYSRPKNSIGAQGNAHELAKLHEQPHVTFAEDMFSEEQCRAYWLEGTNIFSSDVSIKV